MTIFLVTVNMQNSTTFATKERLNHFESNSHFTKFKKIKIKIKPEIMNEKYLLPLLQAATKSYLCLQNSIF